MLRFPRWVSHVVVAVMAGGALVAPVVSATSANAITIPASDFQKVTLAAGPTQMGEPLSLAVLPDRSVLHTARDGRLFLTTAAGVTTTAATIPVYTHDEEGLQGVGLDPGFATNRFVFLYYAPALSTPAGDAPETATDFTAWKGENRLSRFTLGTNGVLDMASERIILRVPTDRGQCCHTGGDIDFDAQGNLYLTTGDDSNPFQSDAYSPLDDRANRNPVFDARRSAGNTNDLRGKLLRIKVNADGTYSNPAGNLFAPGTAGTRPEIYAMGLRNPFRMSVDKRTGVVYLGDYGPDAGVTDPNRGPQGQVEFNRITSAGNYGWPYCTGSNTSTETYNRFNFDTRVSGAKFNCAAPANESRYNTGLATLPAARAAWIKYAGDSGTPPAFNEGGGSESPMGGPVYNFDPANPSTVKFPQYLDNLYFAGEFGRQWIKTVAVNADGSAGEISSFPWTGTQVMDMAFGPDGALYVLDYGTGGNNQALYRVEYIGGGNRAPTA
ncbi:MAG: glycosyl hydrolase, partial [Frankiales bacterium]|nr:glycosyl hydrolase [Frankiales bacterium]